MGFRVQRRRATLQLDEPFEGAEIYARLDVSTGTFFELERLQAATDIGLTERQRLEAALAFFVDNVVTGWNLEEEDGSPIPLTVAAVMDLPVAIVSQLIPKWKEAAVGVPAPLGSPSGVGDTSAEAPTNQEGQ
jgi:hypothetical protein